MITNRIMNNSWLTAMIVGVAIGGLYGCEKNENEDSANSAKTENTTNKNDSKDAEENGTNPISKDLIPFIGSWSIIQSNYSKEMPTIKTITFFQDGKSVIDYEKDHFSTDRGGDWTYDPATKILSSSFIFGTWNITLTTDDTWVGIGMAKNDGRLYSAKRIWFPFDHLFDRTFVNKTDHRKTIKFDGDKYKYDISGTAFEYDTAYIKSLKQTYPKANNYGCAFVKDWGEILYLDSNQKEYSSSERNRMVYEGAKIPLVNCIRLTAKSQSHIVRERKSTIEIHNIYNYNQTFLKVNVKRYYYLYYPNDDWPSLMRIDSIVGTFIPQSKSY